MRAQRVKKDRREAKVTTERRGHRVSEVVRASPAPEGIQDLQALDRKVTKVLMEILGFLDPWDLSVLPDRKVHKGSPDFLGLQVSQALRVSVARQDHLGLKVTEETLDFKDSKVNLVIKVSEVFKVNRDYQVCLGSTERKAPKDQWDFLDQMAQKDQGVNKDLPDHLDSEVLLGLLGMLDFQEHQGFKDHQGYQGIQDDLEPKVMSVRQDELSMQLVPLLLESQDHLGLLVLPALQDLQDYQVPLVLLVCLANLVLKVTED